MEKSNGGQGYLVRIENRQVSVSGTGDGIGETYNEVASRVSDRLDLSRFPEDKTVHVGYAKPGADGELVVHFNLEARQKYGTDTLNL